MKMNSWMLVPALALLMTTTAMAQPRDRDNNPPGPRGGHGTNWENPPGWRGAAVCL